MRHLVLLLLASLALAGCSDQAAKTAIAQEYNNPGSVQFEDFYIKQTEKGWYVWRAKINAVSDLGRYSGFRDTCGTYMPQSGFVILYQADALTSCDEVVSRFSKGSD